MRFELGRKSLDNGPSIIPLGKRQIKKELSILILFFVVVIALVGFHAFLDFYTTVRVQKQIYNSSIRIQQVDPSDNFSDADNFKDLDYIGKAIGDSKIVALGEATHGTSEFFRMKHRLVNYLVQKKGFTVIAFEAGWPWVEDNIDQYIKTGKSTARDATKKLWLGLMNHEVLNFIKWMRDYNKDFKSPLLTFTAFDFQYRQHAINKVLKYLCRYAPDEYQWFSREYREIQNLGKRPPHTNYKSDIYWNELKSVYQPLLLKAEKAIKRIDSLESKLVDASSFKDFQVARQSAVVLARSIKQNAYGYENSLIEREKAMASQVKWLIEKGYPGQKIVLWAHNLHVGDIDRPFGDKTYDSMGALLREIYGNQLYIIGFGFNHGQVTGGVDFMPGRPNLSFYSIAPPPKDVGDSILGSGPKPNYFVDFRSLSVNSSLSKWLQQPRRYYQIGGEVIDPKNHPEYFMYEMNLKKAYDALIYIRISHASRPLEEIMYSIPRWRNNEKIKCD
jgi:erythromycin esterase